MNQVQVLDEIENIVDNQQQYDILLSRSQANDYEKEMVGKVIGVGREQWQATEAKKDADSTFKKA